MNLTSAFHAMLLNFICFFTMESYIEYYAQKYCPEKKRRLRKVFFFFNIVYSLLPDFPYAVNLAISLTSGFIYIYFISGSSLRQKFILYLKYWRFCFAAMGIIYITHSTITMDFIYSMHNPVYNSYKHIACNFLMYVFLYTYIDIKKQNYDIKESKTIFTFNLLIGSMSIFISISPLLLKFETQASQNLLFVIFSILMFLILLTLSIHKRMFLILNENMKIKFELEANHLKEEYSKQLGQNITELRRLRHDIKNHFIVINGYAKKNHTEKIIHYINRMAAEYSSYNTITTPSDFVSSILSAKQQICKKQNIRFECLSDFQEICFDDFDMLTILGNLLDNAILAAGKCENGVISLKIIQKDSYLVIDCQNNHKEHLLSKKDKLLSTKKDNENHGIGLGNIQQAVEKENGTMHIEYDDSTFKVSIIIPNYKR